MRKIYAFPVLVIIGIFIAALWGMLKSPVVAPVTDTVPTMVIEYRADPSIAESMEEGSCWTSSVSAPWRDDAWRCLVDSSIHDPCFETEVPGELLCNVDPSNRSTRIPFVLKINEPLPDRVSSDYVDSNKGWFLTLSNGAVCTPLTGTRAVTEEGIASVYGCSGASAQGDTIWGELDATKEKWIATIGSYTPPVSPSVYPTIGFKEEVSVETVWR